MKILNNKQFERLQKVEKKAWKYANNLKTWNPDSIGLQRIRREWDVLCESFGIFQNDGFTIKYKCENGKDYSHGYDFTDVLA